MRQLSTACPYCASQLVDVDRGGELVDRVAPFRVPRPAALDRLRRHLAHRIWAPRALQKLATTGAIQTRLQGMLVPFFVYDAECRSTYRARVGVHWYRSEKVRGKDGKTRDKRVQETEWFSLRGTAAQRLLGHAECASRALSSSEVRGLRGFDLGRATRFDPHLLAGWCSELATRVRSEVDREAMGRIRAREVKRIRSRVLPGDTHRGVTVDCDVKVLGVQFMLLPVWITTYKYGGNVFRMLVHGQTGRCFGSAPVSRGKVVAAASAVAAIGLLILYLSGVLG